MTEESKFSFKPNVIKTDLGSYIHFWCGEPKIGKTTLFRDIVLEEYGDTKHGLLISIGNETGYKALGGVYATETKTWEEFKSLVDHLVENKSDNDFNIIGLDTVDQLVKIAMKRTLKDSFRRTGKKPKTINSAMGGYRQGHYYAAELIDDQVSRIENAGYGIIFIGHTKVGKVKDDNSENPRQELTNNLQEPFKNLFISKSDIMATFRNEGRVNDDDGTVTSKRNIYFREDGFVKSGSRFIHMTPCVELSAKNYISAFEKGVKDSLSEKTSDDKISKMKTGEIELRKKKGKEYSESEKNKISLFGELKTVEDYRKAIKDEINSLEDESKKQKKAELEELGIEINYSKITDIEALKVIFKKVLEK